ncbi:hypothetical protein SAMD00019534_084720 [Acytostelium subglobosum LB1]|uniref:hypothetical protein n=1 Tax=Acytostelium subglobosum LB1 TaxID=1410327 RepID=UPI0006448568|nr:hypothetical protein SAMD00019534_084720 [Acytostelium subglobosum LB1]GAM25297.1 hypothetical protein SAMD00019534_084720 [Acytostelium subglobosum LB1]|eukprot:XP_012751817.1 hypothetical protein SAMD00019534_084720 [Acytostelium subglobosum LB1]
MLIQQTLSSTTLEDSTTLAEDLTPRQINLALTENSDDMLISWITNGVIKKSTVYYYAGACVDSGSNSLDKLAGDKTIIVSIGTTTTYYPYSGYLHSVRLNSLTPNTKYCYSVGGEVLRNSSNLQNWSSWRQFQTAPGRDHSVTFVALADCGTYGNVIPVMASLAQETDVSLVLHAGDLSYGLNESVWDTFGNLVEPVASQFPYMVIPGNWDVKPGAINAYYNRYHMPLAYPSPTTSLRLNEETGLMETKTNYHLFYTIEYSHAFIIMLSSYDPYDEQSIQYKWLVQQLEHVQNNRHKFPWLIVGAHSPMYSSSTGHGGGDVNFRSAIEHLLKEYKVNLVISGHDHCYERSYPAYDGKPLNDLPDEYTSDMGTVHLLAGTGGADQDPWLPRPDWTAHRENSAGYTKVKASPLTLEVTYLRYNGSIGDRFRITNVDTDGPQGSTHLGLIMLVIFLMVLVFPLCAYSGLPSRIFNSIMVGGGPYVRMGNSIV